MERVVALKGAPRRFHVNFGDESNPKTACNLEFSCPGSGFVIDIEHRPSKGGLERGASSAYLDLLNVAAFRVCYVFLVRDLKIPPQK